jgi:hypothetical protein
VEEHELETVGHYCIRVRKGDWEVEVSAPEKGFVLTESDRLIEKFILNVTAVYVNEAEATQDGATAHIEGQPRYVKPQTLNEFFRQFKLQTHLEKILVLGYWCEIKQGQPHFTSDDILAKYKEVKEPPPANVRRDLGNLVAKGLLLSVGKSGEGVLTYELTNTGIKEVESKLPQA